MPTWSDAKVPRRICARTQMGGAATICTTWPATADRLGGLRVAFSLRAVEAARFAVRGVICSTVRKGPAVTVERDRNWYREQVVLLRQEVDRMQAGYARDGDRPLGQCLAELAICAEALDNLEGADAGLPAPREGFV